MADRPILNPALPIEDLRRDFAREHYVSIADALEPSLAEELYACFEAEEERFLLRFRGGVYPKTLTLDEPLSDASKRVLDAQLAVAREAGMFTYIYYHWELQRDCREHAACVLGDFFRGAECWSFVRSLTGVDVSSSDVAGVTRFERGHYLGKHSDRLAKFGPFRRRVAYCLYFCRNWEEQYGGCLIHETDDGVSRETVPGFNHLVLFDLGEGGVARHAVTPIVSDDVRRFTMPGFFCVPDGEEPPSKDTPRG